MRRFPALVGAKQHNTRAQFDPAHPEELLLCHASERPFIVNVTTGHVRTLPRAVLTQRQVDDGRRIFCDAAFVCGGTRIVVASGKGTLTLVKSSTFAVVAKHHVRAGLLSVPRVFVGTDSRWVLVASRAGILAFHAATLECVDRGYREGVDNTPLSLCTLSHDRATLVAAPGPEGHSSSHNNRLFFFRTGIAGDIRIVVLPEPLERARSLLWHPHRPMLVACMTTGNVYMLHRPYQNSWPVRPPMLASARRA